MSDRLDQGFIGPILGRLPEEKGANMRHKYVETDASATDSGTFTALVASFNTVDRGGDLILPGSFRRTLERWRKSNRRIPVIWSHGHDDPAKVIGSVDPSDARESEDGLVVTGRLDLSSETAREVLRLLKSGDVDGWSFGYRVPSGGQRRRNGHNEIREIDLLELGPTAVPMNAEARTLAAKSAETASVDYDSMSLEELRKASLDLVSDVDTRPIKIATFEC